MNALDRSTLWLAQDPSTPQETLVTLSTHRRLCVRRAVAENPNTPGDVLLRLGHLFPKSFAQNPAVPLLLIEDPSFLGRHPTLLQRLLSLRALPEFIWREAKRHHSREVRILLADSPYTPPAVLASLLYDPSAIVQRRALLNGKTPPKEKEQRQKSRTIGDAIAEICESLGYAPKSYAQLTRALATICFREAEILRICFGLPEADDPLEEAIFKEKDLRDFVDPGEVSSEEKRKAAELQVLRRRFGIGEERENTRGEVGQDFEVTREHIRSIEAKALRKLRCPSRSKRLRAFLGQ